MIGRLVLLLLAANLGWLAWTQGWLRPLGLVPQEQAEPQRLQRQVQPQALRLQPLEPASAGAAADDTPARRSTAASATPASAAEPAAAPASAPAPTACLQIGTFDASQIEAVRQAAAGLPEGSWRVDAVQLPGRWMVYLGKLPDAAAVAARRAELRAQGVDTDRPGAALEPGLSLGRFASEEAAERALDSLARKGVRGARVVRERRDTPAYLLRLPQADAALRRQARALNGALGGHDWRPCE